MLRRCRRSPLGVAGCVLTWEVIGRYFLSIPSDWQDELSVFLLVGATFGVGGLDPGAARPRRRSTRCLTCCPPGLTACGVCWRISLALPSASSSPGRCWTLLLRGLGGRADHPFRLGTAAVDSLWAAWRSAWRVLVAAAAAAGRCAATSDRRNLGTLRRMSTLQSAAALCAWRHFVRAVLRHADRVRARRRRDRVHAVLHAGRLARYGRRRTSTRRWRASRC